MIHLNMSLDSLYLYTKILIHNIAFGYWESNKPICKISLKDLEIFQVTSGIKLKFA